MKITLNKLCTILFVIFCFGLAHCEKKIDYKTATKEELLKLVEEDDVEAMLQLGRNAIIKDNHDLETAIKYFKMAADKENGIGIYNYIVAKSILNPEANDFEQNEQNRIDLKKAYELGSHHAQSQYARLLILLSYDENNKRIKDKKSFEEARRLSEEAADKYDDPEAYCNLALWTGCNNHSFNLGDEADYYFIKSIEKGSWEGYNFYAGIIYNQLPPDQILQRLSKWKDQFPLEYEMYECIINDKPLPKVPDEYRYSRLEYMLE